MQRTPSITTTAVQSQATVFTSKGGKSTKINKSCNKNQLKL